MLLPFALALGEQIMPARLDALFVLALGSQVSARACWSMRSAMSRRWSSASAC